MNCLRISWDSLKTQALSWPSLSRNPLSIKWSTFAHFRSSTAV